MNKLLALSTAAIMAVTGAMAGDSGSLESDVKKLKKDVKRLKKNLSAVRAQAAADNIKWNVDFRTSYDYISAERASGEKDINGGLLANRLWLGMGYKLNDNMVFKGQLSYNKAYGAAPTNPSTGYPQRGYGYDTFDWVVNENLTTDTIRVKEAYWLYMNDDLFGSDIYFTGSFGRRPSLTGFLAAMREDDNAKSPLGHIVNVEFDGASFKFGLDKVIPIPGLYAKLCMGRGLTNARSRFNLDGGFTMHGDYSEDKTTLENIDLAGVILSLYNDGQYQIESLVFRGFNLPGFQMMGGDTGMIVPQEGSEALLAPMIANPSLLVGMNAAMMGSMVEFNQNVQMVQVGHLDGGALSGAINGIGDGWSDFLDDTILFGSVAFSRTNPNNKNDGLSMTVADDGTITSVSTKTGMLGSNEKETGHSYWVGLQIPAMITEDGRIGIEYNHGSKYWRSFTYGEDTLAASKLATRGDAYEAYWTQPLMGKAFTAQLRYTHIKYDYTGSQFFFGDDGTPWNFEQAAAFGMDPVKEAQDIRFYLRYRY
jgi:hypothetical protein